MHGYLLLFIKYFQLIPLTLCCWITLKHTHHTAYYIVTVARLICPSWHQSERHILQRNMLCLRHFTEGFYLIIPNVFMLKRRVNFDIFIGGGVYCIPSVWRYGTILSISETCERLNVCTLFKYTTTHLSLVLEGCHVWFVSLFEMDKLVATFVTANIQ